MLRLVVHGIVAAQAFQSGAPLVDLVGQCLVVPIILVIDAGGCHQIAYRVQSLGRVREPPGRSEAGLSGPTAVAFEPMPVLVASRLFAFAVVRRGQVVLVVRAGRVGRGQVSLDAFQRRVDQRLQCRRVQAAVRARDDHVHVAFERVDLLDHVVVADPTGWQGARPIRVMRGEEPAHADGVQHHQIDVHARGGAGQVQRAGLYHGGEGVLREFGPQAGTMLRLVERGHGDLREKLVQVARHGGRQVLAGQLLVFAVHGGGQLFVRVLALLPDGQFATLPVHHVVEHGPDFLLEVAFHVVGPERRPFQTVRHATRGGRPILRLVPSRGVVHDRIRFPGLVGLVRRGGFRRRGRGGDHLVEELVHSVVAHAVAPSVSCHAWPAEGRRSSNPSRHQSRSWNMIMCTRAGAWPNGSTSA